MNPFKAIAKAFVVTGKFLARGFKAAKANGLADALVQSLLDQYIPKAAALWPNDNTARREWVVENALKASKGKVPEHIIRLGLELAIASMKKPAAVPPVEEPLPPPPAEEPVPAPVE